MGEFPAGLKLKVTDGGRVEKVGENTWRLEIAAGEAGNYRLAQLDDYSSFGRKDFPWQPSLRLSLRARASARSLPGTWGFGLWNEPFGVGILTGAQMRRLPVLPQAAWFFFASAQNYLSLRDDLPASGKLAATFRSKRWPTILTALGAPLLALVALPPAAIKLRRLARSFIRQDTAALELDVTEWHTYQLYWKAEAVHLQVDGTSALNTTVVPHGPLGLVIWIDNQFAAFPPSGRVSMGTLPTEEPAWIEIGDLVLQQF